MEDKIRLLLFRIIYDDLNLKIIEDEFLSNNIPQKKIVLKKGEELISHYFFLRNDIYLERLNQEEQESLKQLINSNRDEDQKTLNEFLKKNMFRLILPETNQKYLYWDGFDFQHMAPADAIVIAFHTLNYLDVDFSIIEKQKSFINEKLNYIQEELAQQAGYKVAVLEYDEMPNMSQIDPLYSFGINRKK